MMTPTDERLETATARFRIVADLPDHCYIGSFEGFKESFREELGRQLEDAGFEPVVREGESDSDVAVEGHLHADTNLFIYVRNGSTDVFASNGPAMAPEDIARKLIEWAGEHIN
jgi:hypothetical protein